MTDQQLPCRLLIRGRIQDAWWRATPEELDAVLAAWAAVHTQWQEKGCRLVATMDDLSIVGQAPPGTFNFYTMWEIPTPELLGRLLQPFSVEPPTSAIYEEPAYEVRLSRYFSLEAVLGKPIVSMERDLGGPVQATHPVAGEPRTPQ